MDNFPTLFKNSETAETFHLSFLNKALQEGTYTDVSFSCKTENDPNITECIQAHQTILILASPVFEKMLLGDKDQKYTIKEDVIEIVDINASAFKNFIEIIYGKHPTISSVKSAIELCYAGDKYNIDAAVEIGGQFITKKLKEIENIIPVYELCVQYGNQKFKEKCLELFRCKTDEILLDASFLTCQPATFLTIAGLDSLHIDSEMRLVEAYLNYVDVNKNLKEDVDDVLKSIKFLNIEVNDLVRICLFTAEELVCIMRISSNCESVENMPLGLSTDRNNRCTKILKPERENLFNTSSKKKSESFLSHRHK